MPFFQNVYIADYRGSFPLGDRQKSPTFICPKNAGRGNNIVVAWNNPSYDFTGNDSAGNPTNVLTIWMAFDSGNFKNWGSITVNPSTAAANAAATTALEVAASLNADAGFSPLFTANVNQAGQVYITQIAPVTRLHFYIANGQAEEIMRFNQRSGVAQLPNYCARETIANGHSFPDSESLLIQLDPANNVDAGVINNACNSKGKLLGYSSSNVSPDWVLLNGETGIFTFSKCTYDGSSRVTTKIEYPAGAQIGAFARKTEYIYSGASTVPEYTFELPYVLAAGDLPEPLGSDSNVPS